MFHENDKPLRIVRIIMLVNYILSLLAVLIAFIWVAVALENGWYILFIPLGWLSCWIAWIFAQMYLCFLCDVKLIRNKLYDAENRDLAVFSQTGVSTPLKAFFKNRVKAAQMKTSQVNIRNASGTRTATDSNQEYKVLGQIDYTKYDDFFPVVITRMEICHSEIYGRRLRLYFKKIRDDSVRAIYLRSISYSASGEQFDEDVQVLQVLGVAQKPENFQETFALQAGTQKARVVITKCLLANGTVIEK